MATDALLALQASVVKTATFQGAALDLVTRPPVGMTLWARVLYSAAANGAGANSVTFTVEGSVDNVNWTTIGGARPSDVVNLSTTAQAGEVFIPIEGFVRYVRLVATLAGAGTGSTFTYKGDVVLAAPA